MRQQVKRHLITVDSEGYIDQVLRHMAQNVEFVNKENGWYEDDRTFFDELFLLTSEVVEAGEAWRVAGFDDMTYTDTACHIPGTCPHGDLHKPEGVGSELADVLIRLLDTAARHGIDLAAEYRRKMAYNRTRGYRHGGKRL